MYIAWYIATGVLGIALGLHFGRLLTAIIAHWESTKIASNVSMSVVAFLFGGGGGAALFEYIAGDSGPFYVAGIAIGMIYAFFAPPPWRYTFESVALVLKMNDELQQHVPDVQQRALLILAALVPPKQIQRDAKLSEAQLADDLERATDMFPENESQGTPDVSNES
jgi:hypothetical protein